MLANITVFVRCHLQTTLLHILVEIPSKNLHDLLITILGHYLEPVLHLGLLNFHDFHAVREIDSYVIQDLVLTF